MGPKGAVSGIATLFRDFLVRIENKRLYLDNEFSNRCNVMCITD